MTKTDPADGTPAVRPEKPASRTDVLYWLGATAVALALIAPAPFFWAPPAWIMALMFGQKS